MDNAGATATSSSPEREAKIIKYNYIAAVLHFVQALVMAILGGTVTSFREFKLPVNINYLGMVEGAGDYLVLRTEEIGLLPIGPLVSIFFFLSAFFHALVVSPWYQQSYLNYLRIGQNPFRWIEYSISSSVMIWLIAMLFGVADISLLISIFVMNAVMNFCGMLMEQMNDGKSPVNWLPFILGTVLGATTWLVIFIYFFGSGPSSDIPGFVYGVLFSYLLFFNTFPVNMVLVYKKYGRWSEYMFGEFMYIVLSLFSKTLLGWLVFGGVNQPNQYN